MFTKNWYYALAAYLSSGIAASTTDFPYIKTMSGAYQTSLANIQSWPQLYANSGAFYMPEMDDLRPNLTSYGGAIIGTGTTPPTLEDYKLSGTQITTFTSSSAISREADDSGCTLKAVYTITNTGTEDFTVGEIGLIAGSAGSGAAYKTLLERTVLDTPVTIAAGGVGLVTYTIRVNYPT